MTIYVMKIISTYYIFKSIKLILNCWCAHITFTCEQVIVASVALLASVVELVVSIAVSALCCRVMCCRSRRSEVRACVLVAAWLEQPNQIEGTVSHLLLVLALLLRSAFVLIEFLVMLHDIRICVHKTEYNFVHCRQQAIFKVGT